MEETQIHVDKPLDSLLDCPPMSKPTVPPAVSAYFSALGRKGGKRGSRKDKSRAGKLGIKAMHKKLTKQAQQ